MLMVKPAFKLVVDQVIILKIYRVRGFTYSQKKQFRHIRWSAYISVMKFEATIQEETYIFSSIRNNLFLVSGSSGEYILYRTSKWNCADDIPGKLVLKLGEAIDEYLLLHNKEQEVSNRSYS